MSHNDLVLAAGIAGVVVLVLVWRYLWVIAIWAVAAAVDVAVIRGTTGWQHAAAYAALPVLFLLWVLFFPYATCPVCKGKGGTTFLLMSRRCWYCDGGKTKQRFTARLLGRGYPRQPGSWIAPKTRKKNP